MANASGLRDPMHAFMQVLEEYKIDKNFCIPEQVKNIFVKYGEDTRFIFLGGSHYVGVFLKAISGAKKGVPAYVVDDFKCHKGDQYAGLDIISTDKFLEIYKKENGIVVLNCCRFDFSKRFFDEICRFHKIPCLNHEQVTRLFDLNDTIDYRFSDWGEVIFNRVDEFMGLEKRLGDAYSKETLLRVLSFHLSGNSEHFLNISRPYSSLYFRSGLLNFGAREKFVDCGACFGEATVSLLGVTNGAVEHAWMFEPDINNQRSLQKLLRRYQGTYLDGKITLHPYAVGEVHAEVAFIHEGGYGARIAPVEDLNFKTTKIRPIDDVIDDIPTLIKMDIEGFEIPALKGAARAIRAGSPQMAISAYHRSTDLLEIPKLLDSIDPEYELGLRHHSEDRAETCFYFYKNK